MIAAQDLSNVIVLTSDGRDRRIAGAIEAVAISSAQISEEYVHRLGSLKWEPRVSAVFGELSWEIAKEETTKRASISWAFRITLAVCEAP